MRPVARFCLVALLSQAAPLLAETPPWNVTVHLHAQRTQPTAALALTAEAAGGPQCGEPKTANVRLVEGQGEASLLLNPKCPWRLRLVSRGFWAVEQLVVPLIRTVEVPVWLTGTLQGGASVPRGEPEPTAIAISLSGSPNARIQQGSIVPKAEVECPIREHRWSCEVPAGQLDLRLRPPGFLAQYRWSFPVLPGKAANTGAMAFVRGASITGWIGTADGALDPKTCRVELQPQQNPQPTLASLDPQAAAHRETMTETAQANDRGVFHIDGIRRGVYSLTVSQPGFSPARVPFLTVYENGLTDTGKIELQRPRDVDFQIAPALDIRGKPWNVQLFRGSRESTLEDDVSRAADTDGSLTIAKLAPGLYSVRVSDAGGSTVGWREFELPTRESPIAVDLAFVWVEGRLKLGDAALSGDLWFGGRRGMTSVRMTADSKGLFVGLLPKAGTWRVDVDADIDAVHVHRRKLKVSVPEVAVGSTARVEIVLPDGYLHGTVVDPDGEPAAGARVRLRDESSPTEAISAEDGTFQFSALTKGRALVSAERHELQSEQVSVAIGEERDGPPLRLQLRRKLTLRGTLLSPGGPLPGVQVIALPMQAGMFNVTPGANVAATDENGRFEFKIGEVADRVQIIAFPPAFTLVSQVLPLPASAPIALQTTVDGGTLRLRFGVPKADFDASTQRVAIFADGQSLDEGLLRNWAGINSVINSDPRSLVVPQLRPGFYKVCRLPSTARVDVLARVGSDASVAAPWPCVEGGLYPGADLTLDVPDE